MLSSSRPASPGLGQPALQVRAQRPVGGERVSGRVRGDEGADARASGDQAVVLELAVGLEHGVRVDRQPGHHVLDGGQLVALLQQAQPQSLPNLLHELQVGRDAGPLVQVELDHWGTSLH